jgi:hypothetical protein
MESDNAAIQLPPDRHGPGVLLTGEMTESWRTIHDDGTVSWTVRFAAQPTPVSTAAALAERETIAKLLDVPPSSSLSAALRDRLAGQAATENVDVDAAALADAYRVHWGYAQVNATCEQAANTAIDLINKLADSIPTVPMAPPLPDVFVVQIFERHSDPEAEAWLHEQAAIERAREVAAQYAHSPTDIRPLRFNEFLEGDGVIFGLDWGPEGDRVRVLRRSVK